MPSGSSPMDSSRFAISFRLNPASISKRTWSVFTNVAFPRLPLPRTETVIAMHAISLMHRTRQGNVVDSQARLLDDRKTSCYFSFMIRTRGLTHIHLTVRNMKRSLRFYQQVF